jgi:isopentenyl-diphosphate Delta-isomerase
VSTRSQADPSGIGGRKKKHVEICVDSSTYSVETGPSCFEGVSLLHEALPDLDAGAVDTRCRFLDHEIALPLFISCMTGGSAEGFAANTRLASAAQIARVPVGLGSIRILFHEPDVFPHFHVKPLAPDVPVLANIGAVQVRDVPHETIIEMSRRLEVQAIVVHLNPGQELFQPDGDRDFRGLEPAIGRLCAASPLPVIVKETGFGIHPGAARRLLGLGARYVDVAGTGGTNWVAVESYRLDGGRAQAARELDGWGLPTAVLLDALSDHRGRILASGGVRTGLDVAKSLALGAELAGMALPFIRAVAHGGVEGALEVIEKISEVLRAAMVLTGSADVAALRSASVLRTPAFTDAVDAVRSAVAAQRPRRRSR